MKLKIQKVIPMEVALIHCLLVLTMQEQAMLK